MKEVGPSAKSNQLINAVKVDGHCVQASGQKGTPIRGGTQEIQEGLGRGEASPGTGTHDKPAWQMMSPKPGQKPRNTLKHQG